MPDSAPVNVSKLASKIADALRSVDEPLLIANFRADPVAPLMADARKLLSELRRIVNSKKTSDGVSVEVSVTGENIILNSMKNLEELYLDANQLVTISSDIESGPST